MFYFSKNQKGPTELAQILEVHFSRTKTKLRVSRGRLAREQQWSPIDGAVTKVLKVKSEQTRVMDLFYFF